MILVPRQNEDDDELQSNTALSLSYLLVQCVHEAEEESSTHHELGNVGYLWTRQPPATPADCSIDTGLGQCLHRHVITAV
jgi:hypothetical protein